MLTCGIFAVSWYLSSYFTERKIVEIRNTQNKVATDIMSNETQFDLLQEVSCEDSGSTYLSDEISSLAEKITYGEQNLDVTEEILLLKQQYTLLEVKDFLFTKRVSERCNSGITTILYFYATKNECDNCVKQGYVLDAIREEYPKVRIYSFDYNLDSSTVRALRTIYKIPETLPALVVNGRTYNGFISVEELKAAIPTESTKK